MDVEIQPLKKPGNMLEWKEFKRDGAVFWQDFHTALDPEVPSSASFPALRFAWRSKCTAI